MVKNCYSHTQLAQLQMPNATFSHSFSMVLLHIQTDCTEILLIFLHKTSIAHPTQAIALCTLLHVADTIDYWTSDFKHRSSTPQCNTTPFTTHGDRRNIRQQYANCSNLWL